MHKYVDESNGQLVFIGTKAGLVDLVANREKGNRAVACMLEIEGAHASGRLTFWC